MLNQHGRLDNSRYTGEIGTKQHMAQYFKSQMAVGEPRVGAEERRVDGILGR